MKAPARRGGWWWTLAAANLLFACWFAYLAGWQILGAWLFVSMVIGLPLAAIFHTDGARADLTMMGTAAALALLVLIAIDHRSPCPEATSTLDCEAPR